MIVEWRGSGTLGAASSHELARADIERAFRSQFGREPSLRQAQMAQAVSAGESGYGRAWKSEGEGSHNMGAIQVPGGPPCDPAVSFEKTDTRADGTPYQACFRRYPSRVAGWSDFLRVLYERRPTVLAAANGSIRGFSTALRKSGYFELPLEEHIKAMQWNLGLITRALDEPMPPLQPPPRRNPLVVAGVAGAVLYGAWRAWEAWA